MAQQSQQHRSSTDHISRRALLLAAAPAALAIGSAQPAHSAVRHGPEPFPLEAVRLANSDFRTAVDSNRTYLMRLEPDRLLHFFRVNASLAPKANAYGGWEADTISGHSLGHYLSACALMHAQTGDAACKERALYIVSELRSCQGDDGFVAGIRRKNSDGSLENGRKVFEEVARGDIRPSRFALNGSWSPLYNWHKMLAGLLDADRYCTAPGALDIVKGVGRYLEATFASLSDAQMQTVLDCEHGGINESFAELCARTGETRWLALAHKLYHRKVLDPLAQQQDDLSFLHSNTQIPKVIGLARLHELTGDPRYYAAAAYFWDDIVHGRTYVIGGNSDREYFQEANSLSRYITEQTCESCNTYNMMKLTRLLYRQRPSAAYFDYYERAHFNHILAQHRPSDGMFAYMVPLISGASREWSEPFDSFWCCCGSGMESHSKHGDSIYWRSDDGVIVNLFIASELDWRARQVRIRLETAYPYDDRIVLHVDPQAASRFSVALRIPAWCENARALINGEITPVTRDANSYFIIRRWWRSGDRVVLILPRSLRFEATPDDPNTMALLDGPLALAADLGPTSETWTGPAPALVGEDVLSGLAPIDAQNGTFRCVGVSRPGDLSFAPFYRQYDRRTAVYFKRYTPAQWDDAQRDLAETEARQHALDARSTDIIALGVEADEQRHNMTSALSYAVSYRFKPGRDARSEGFFEFDMVAGNGPLVFRATYWGGERDRRFHIFADGVEIGQQTLNGEHAGEFIDEDYPIPPRLSAGKRKLRIRIAPDAAVTAGPVFGARIYRPL